MLLPESGLLLLESGFSAKPHLYSQIARGGGFLLPDPSDPPPVLLKLLQGKGYGSLFFWNYDVPDPTRIQTDPDPDPVRKRGSADPDLYPRISSNLAYFYPRQSRAQITSCCKQRAMQHLPSLSITFHISCIHLPFVKRFCNNFLVIIHALKQNP
jgi:hypothetical protein